MYGCLASENKFKGYEWGSAFCGETKPVNHPTLQPQGWGGLETRTDNKCAWVCSATPCGQKTAGGQQLLARPRSRMSGCILQTSHPQNLLACFQTKNIQGPPATTQFRIFCLPVYCTKTSSLNIQRSPP
jgi:hypothetical protein